ncbi:hypothetical protein [Ferrovibrio sp.]|uniref:hypothetical protein n=1 Tax=Ferrovibrio sp. TaxID=1917215 RepID=UPI00311D37CD
MQHSVGRLQRRHLPVCIPRQLRNIKQNGDFNRFLMTQSFVADVLFTDKGHAPRLKPSEIVPQPASFDVHAIPSDERFVRAIVWAGFSLVHSQPHGVRPSGPPMGREVIA